MTLIFVKNVNKNKMSVVNCKVKYIRDRGYNNLKEWMEDEENVYVARCGIVFIDEKRFPPNSSPFANKWKVGPDGTREEVLEKYEKWLDEKLRNDPKFKKKFLLLKGKNLGCWCHPEKCHADIILKILKKLI